MILANLEFAVAIPQMEAVALTVSPHFAMGTLVGLHPFAVTVFLEAVLPHLPEAVLVDVALMIIASDTEAARDGAIG